MIKLRLVKTFKKLDSDLITKIKSKYPYGFDKKMIMIPNKKGKLESALPFETEKTSYLIKISLDQAHSLYIDKAITETDFDVNEIMDLDIDESITKSEIKK